MSDELVATATLPVMKPDDRYVHRDVYTDTQIRDLIVSGKPLDVSKLIGCGYDEFWFTRKFYRVLKGSKGSKKSFTISIWYIYHMMKYPDANLLVIRRVRDTLRDSCFAQLQKAIDKLGVGSLWKCTTSPMEMVFKPTGQKILFKGMDDASKLMSVGVSKGYLCWCWIEEAYEIANEDEFEKLQMSIRGKIPPETGLFKQITLSFNPWSECWLKTKFFDNPPINAFVDTTTYRCNEFLDDVDRFRYEELYRTNPRNARIICDGDWGVAEGLIYTDWEVSYFDLQSLLMNPSIQTSCGLDFGFSISYNAFVAVAVDLTAHTLWVYDEWYDRGTTNLNIAKKIIEKGYGKETIFADSASTKDIFTLRQGIDEVEETGTFTEEGDPIVITHHYSLPGIEYALKGQDSVEYGIRNLQSFHIILHPNCVNAIREINLYCYEQNREGKYTGKPLKENDHIWDAVRYAMSRFFVHGSGRIVEAGERAVVVDTDKPRKCHRVASTL